MGVPVKIVRKFLDGELSRDDLRKYVRPVARKTIVGLQLSMWLIDADGLPERPWRLDPSEKFTCTKLNCKNLTVGTCVLRQQISDVQRNRAASYRGQGSQYPHCVTEHCEQGRGIRLALGNGIRIPWAGAGAGQRFEKMRSVIEQSDARKRLARVGLLEKVRTLDVDEDPHDEK